MGGSALAHGRKRRRMPLQGYGTWSRKTKSMTSLVFSARLGSVTSLLHGHVRVRVTTVGTTTMMKMKKCVCGCRGADESTGVNGWDPIDGHGGEKVACSLGIGVRTASGGTRHIDMAGLVAQTNR